MSTIRLLPFALGSGPWNMAADDALLESAVAGIGSLRFYGWDEATLSLGYFQPSATAREDPRLEALPWVRRPSGGSALVHHHELTYAVALPAGATWQPGGSWLGRMHGVIQQALGQLGVESQVCEREEKHGEVLCFLHQVPGDLLIEGLKVVGSAQRKQRGAVLQHGGILLAQSPWTPGLPGIAELSGRILATEEVQGAIVEVLGDTMGWRIEPGVWTKSEGETIAARIATRYTQAPWNAKR